MVIINTGHRPVTIDQVFVEVKVKRRGPVEATPQRYFWADADGYKHPTLPLTLEDEKMAVLYVSDHINGQLSKSSNLTGQRW